MLISVLIVIISGIALSDDLFPDHISIICLVLYSIILSKV